MTFNQTHLLSSKKGFTIKKNESYVPFIVYNVYYKNVSIGNIQCCVSTGNVYKNRYVTRSSVQEEVDVISITCLDIDIKFRGQGLGTLLIAYALSDLKSINPSINYAIVDDTTTGADSIKNIYAGLGFEYQFPIALVGSNKIGPLQGPERQLRGCDKIVECREYLLHFHDFIKHVTPD
uniref:N-acetyltransferase domain-containing protein n=1 Tax=viral metagenome TaxID=1070528 RepID=A0A6C0HFS5_9ZZZZ